MILSEVPLMAKVTLQYQSELASLLKTPSLSTAVHQLSLHATIYFLSVYHLEVGENYASLHIIQSIS